MDRYIDEEAMKNESFTEAEKELFAKRKKLRTKKVVKRIITWVIVIAIILFGIYSYNFKLQNDRWPWVEEKIVSPIDSMKKAQVYESVYTATIDVSGYVQAFESQTVQLRASGAITGVFVKEGDRVKKGQLLATVDSTDQRYNVAEIEKQIEIARANGQTSKKDIELLEMRLDSANQKLDNTNAYANFDGVVVSVDIDEGDFYDAGSKAMEIIDDSKLKTTVEIDEVDLQMLEEGMEANLTSDSCPGENILARVSYIPMVGRYSNQGIGVMDVELVIDNPPKKLKPGFTFEGTIEISSEQKMLLVSQSAVTTKRGVSSVTKLLEDGTTKAVTIQVKYLGENLYQVVGGDVKDGDTVVYSKSTNMLDGIMNSMGGMR